MIFPRNLFNIFFILIFYSCSQNLDFNQIEDYTSDPVFTSSLAFFSVNSENFTAIPGLPATTQIQELSEFRIFENSFIRNNLKQLDFDFEIANDFSRDFTIAISLLNDNNSVIHRFKDLKITANNQNFKQKESLDIVNNPNIRNFVKVLITISLDNTTIPFTTSNNNFLEFKSAVTTYLETSL